MRWLSRSACNCTCSHRNFSKGAKESAHRDKALRRSKPWEWAAQLGVHSRIWKGRHHLKAQQRKSLKIKIFISQYDYVPKTFPEHEYYRYLSYQWALDLLPFLLERSTIYLELADVLRGCTFTTMAWKFPRRRKLAKECCLIVPTFEGGSSPTFDKRHPRRGLAVYLTGYYR